jgi:hypothetical protein
LKKFRQDVITAFFYSRLHYLLHSSYLPIVVCGGLEKCQHIVAFLIIPHVIVKSNTWTVVEIDTSGITQRETNNCLNEMNLLRESLRRVFQNYMLTQDIFVDKQRLRFVACSEKIQGPFPTCSHWAFGMIMHFLSNYAYYQEHLTKTFRLKRHVDPTESFISQWCKQLSTVTDRKADKFLSLLVDTNALFVRYTQHIIFDRIRRLLKRKPNADILNWISYFLRYPDKDNQYAHAVHLFRSLVPQLIKRWNLFQYTESENGKPDQT